MNYAFQTANNNAERATSLHWLTSVLMQVLLLAEVPSLLTLSLFIQPLQQVEKKGRQLT
jgi:hypothetical protein